MEAGIGTALIFTALGLKSSRAQERLDTAKAAYETESAQLAASEAAYESTRQFRQAVGSQIALAGARGGPGSSALRQFSTESYANYLQDQAAIQRKQKGIGIAGTLAKAQAKGDRFNRDLGLYANFGKALTNTINLNPTGGGK